MIVVQMNSIRSQRMTDEDGFTYRNSHVARDTRVVIGPVSPLSAYAPPTQYSDSVRCSGLGLHRRASVPTALT
jgi:hypothetical protein